MNCSASSSAEGNSIRPSERIDEACDRFEAAWRSGSAPRIEDYLAEGLEVDRPALLGELVALERELRRHRGEWPETEDYLERFAGDASVVAAALRETSTPIEGQADRIAMAMTGDAGCNGTGGGRRLPAVLSATAVYRLRGHHARGGLGEVLVAYQEDLDRAVALKRVRPDKLHEEARRRFYREAAITARLQHPGIVPIYGLGQDEDGPFYAMPFIEGQTLQEAINAFHGEESSGRDPGRRALRFRGLLQQLVAVCNTMAYVHDQGVIHRDLKPSNIMLGRYGETLVMDWGLAKRIGTDDARADAEGEAPSPSPSPDDLTATGAVLGTPQYMSPEQVRGEPTSPASDVFSLGLILYAILAGKSPYADAVLRGGRLREAVREAAVVPPRRREPGLPGALEAICLKALAAQPEDRYSNPRDLADDLSKWLADESVGAYRDALADRARRWMKRHRTAVTGGAVALLAVVIGLGAVAAVQIRSNRHITRALGAEKQAREDAQLALSESEEARRRAESVLTFFKNHVLAAARPEGREWGLGRDVTLRKAVDAAEPKIAAAFEDQPAVEADLRHTLGLTYHYVGELERAIRQFGAPRDLRRATLGPDHPDALRSDNELAFTYCLAGRIDEAVALHEATLRRREAVLGPDHPDTLANRNDMAQAYRAAGRYAEAIAMHEASIERMEAKLGPDHPDTLRGRSALAEVCLLAHNDPAPVRLPETLASMEAKLGPDHPETLWCRNHLAEAHRRAGRYDEAISLHESTLRRCEAVLGDDHPDTLASRNNLALAYQVAGRYPEAIAMHERTVMLSAAKLGPDHAETLNTRNNLAAAYRDVDRLADALRMSEETLGLCEAKLGPDHPKTLSSLYWVASVRDRMGRWHDAEALWREALARRRRVAEPDDRSLAADLAAFGNNLLEQSKWSDAEPILRECLNLREKAVPDDWPRFSTMSQLGGALLGRGLYAEAEPLVVPGYEGMKAREAKIPAVGKARLFEAALRVVRLYEEWGKAAQAHAWKDRLGLADLPADVFAQP